MRGIFWLSIFSVTTAIRGNPRIPKRSFVPLGMKHSDKACRWLFHDDIQRTLKENFEKTKTGGRRYSTSPIVSFRAIVVSRQKAAFGCFTINPPRVKPANYYPSQGPWYMLCAEGDAAITERIQMHGKHSRRVARCQSARDINQEKVQAGSRECTNIRADMDDSEIALWMIIEGRDNDPVPEDPESQSDSDNDMTDFRDYWQATAAKDLSVAIVGQGLVATNYGKSSLVVRIGSASNIYRACATRAAGFGNAVLRTTVLSPL